MTNTAILIWIVCIFVDTIGHLFFKAAASHSHSNSGLSHWKNMMKEPWIWLGVIVYVVEFIVWMAFLSVVDLSTAVMLGSINIVVLMVAGRIIFNEKLTYWRILGSLLITAGVALVGLGE